VVGDDVSFCVPFCSSKVIDTVSARCRFLDECGNWHVPLKKWMFRRQMIFVFLGPDTFRYLHDLIAKKKAPVNNSLIALSADDMEMSMNFWKTDPVTATCCFS